MKLNFSGVDIDLMRGVQEVAGILRFSVCDEGYVVSATKIQSGITITWQEDRVEIGYAKKAHFFRGLGLLAENYQNLRNVTEHHDFDELTFMLDVSRNSVITVDTAKKLVRYLALMGYTDLQLYTEDTYEIKGYEYFGYMRGRYTEDEFAAIGEYADLFGVELVPCIQTLAHLGTPLRWRAFENIKDCNDILLADEPKTYELIDAMFQTLSRSFRSRKVNIGMDEAHMLGLGKHLDRHGFKSRSDIMILHLNKVIGICNKYGFKPMMWSDMFFRLAFGNYGGNDNDLQADSSALKNIPEGLTLVYWSYRNSPQGYDKMMSYHKKFKNPIAFAGSAWRHLGYAPLNGYTVESAKTALACCRKNDIRNVIVTSWGDNGGECSCFSVLPGIQFYAEECFNRENDRNRSAKRLHTCTGANFDDFMNLDIPNFTPQNPSPGKGGFNPSKYLLHQDILIGLMDKHVEEDTFAKHYKDCVGILEAGAKDNPDWSYLFTSLAQLCSILELKCDVGIKLKKAYDSDDKKQLGFLRDNILPEIYSRIDIFSDLYTRQWLTENKVFGLEVIQMRLGALQARVNAAITRIDDYLEGRVPDLPELEQERLYFDCNNNENRNINTSANLWHLFATGCPYSSI